MSSIVENAGRRQEKEHRGYTGRRIALIAVIAVLAAATIASRMLLASYEEHLSGADGAYINEVAAKLEEKYGSTAEVMPYDGPGPAARVMSNRSSYIRYSVAVDTGAGKRSGCAYMKVDGLSHTYLGDDLQEAEVVDALVAETSQRVGLDANAVIASYGFVGGDEDQARVLPERGFVERFNGEDALSFVGKHGATVDLVYDADALASPLVKAGFAECPYLRLGVVGVNGRFDGDARGLRDSLATAAVAGTENDAVAADSDTGVYEGSRGWSSSLAKPEVVESLMQLENGEWSVRQPAESVYQFGGERFLRDFEPVDGLRFTREALLGPYNYVGDAGPDLAILLEADDVRSWFVGGVEPVAHVEYGSQADVWVTAPSGDIALRAPGDDADLYRLKLPGAGAFVVLGEELPGVVLYPPRQSQS